MRAPASRLELGARPRNQGLRRAALVVVIAGLVLAPRLFGYDRFPRPEFESGYLLPDSPTPEPRSVFLEYLDVGVLAAALMLSAFLALKVRRRWALAALSLFSLAYFGFWRRGCVCPVGSIQNVALALSDPGYALPIPVLAFFLLPLAATLLFGRTFCGAVCPLGAIQDLVLIKPVRIPRWLGQVLGVMPYLYLGLTILFVVTGTGFLTCRFDPFVSVFRLSGGLAIVIFSLSFVALSLFVGRPYCRFLCPYGVLLGWISRFSRRHVTITPEECVRCRLCSDACPYDAIREAGPDQAAAARLEDRRTDVRRFGIVLLAIPVMIGAFAWAGSRLNGFLAQMNPTVRLARQVVLEDRGEAEETTLESRTFRASGTPGEELLAEAAAVQRGFAVGGWILGGFVGLVLGFRLLSLAVPRFRRDSEPDRAACVSCGRCFAACPIEHRRRAPLREARV